MPTPILVPTSILMPSVSPEAGHSTLTKWFVVEGQRVRAGDVIAEAATETATLEIEAVDGGIIQQILIVAGTASVHRYTPIALLMLDLEPSNPIVAPTVEWTRPAAQPSIPIDRDPAPSAGTPALMQTMREALRDAIAEEMRRDADVFLMGEDVAQHQGAYKVSQGLLQEFGAKRVIDTPITEHGFAGIGIGAAFAGLKPIVEFMTWNFALQAVDQIINSAAKTLYRSGGQIACPIVFRGPNGAASRVGAQHAQCFSAWYAHIPGLKVVYPSNPADAKGLLKAAIRDPNPVLVLENEFLYSTSGLVPTDLDCLVPIGRAKVVRAGRHCTLVAYGRAMLCTLAAADLLAADGIDCEVIDLRSLRPLDMPTILTSIKKTGRVVTVEDAWPLCSIGSEICAQAAIQAFDHLDAPPAKITGADVPMPYAANLEQLALPTVDQVIAAVRAACYAQ